MEDSVAPARTGLSTQNMGLAIAGSGWGAQNSFFLFGSGFRCFFGFSFLVPLTLSVQQLGTRNCHFEWYLLHFGMIISHSAWHLHVLATSWHDYIVHAICHIWQCLPSILHGVDHVSALQPLVCMVFATFGTSNVYVDFLKVSLYKVSCGDSFRIS